MMGLKAQLNRKLHECGRDPLSLFLLGCVIAAALITFMVLSFLLGYILWQGLPNIETGLFALQYNSENVSLFPALVDTVLMVIMALAIATPLGIFAAVYLVEYASRGNRLVSLVRVTADTLAGIPSIVYGLFGMLFFVTYLKWGYSLLAGACTVAIMILPLIMRTTEEALKAIPDSYREGSYGLGAGKLRTVFAVVLPSAVPGILAGVILSIGRIVGETAALIYTAGTVAALPDGVLSSGRTLAVHITGRVLLDNDDIYANDDVNLLRKRVGMVFQKPNPFPMSVYDNIAFGPRTHGVKGKAKLDDMVEEALRKAAIWDEVKDRLDKSALSFSGGQQQRLCIARALAVQPEVLLMDEPTSALDPISTLKIEDLALELKQNYTIVIVTHNMQQAVRISDKTAFFLLGEVVEFNDTDTLFSNPQEKKTEDYITGRFG